MTDEVLFLPDADAAQQLMLNGRAVHSRHAQREAERQAAEILVRSPHSVILLSPGLGFVLDLLLEGSDATLLWIEPDERIREAALRRLASKLTDLRRRIVDGQTIYSSESGDRLILRNSLPDFAHLRSLLPGTPDTWHVFSLRATFRTQYAAFVADLEQRGFRETVNRNTLKRFDKIWLKNLYYNLATASQLRPVSSLFESHRNMPAIVVSAGPSLDRSLPALAEHRSRFILIAVDTAVSALRHFGLDPDYLLSVDAQAPNFLHVRSYTGQATLVVDTTVSYLALRHLKGPYYTFQNPLPAASILLKMLFPDGAGELQFGGSVSTNAFDFALQLGCSPVYLCGLDLSFPENRIHARGSALEEAALAKTHRLHTAHQQNHAQLTAIDRRYLQNSQGRAVPTNDKLLIFYEWYRSRLPAPHVVHVDGGGASFSRVPRIGSEKLAEALATHPKLAEMTKMRPGGSNAARTNGTDTFDTEAKLESVHSFAGDLLERLDDALQAAEDLLAGAPSAELAGQLLQLDKEHGFSVTRLLSSGMQSSLLSNEGASPSGESLTAFFNDLIASLRLHQKLISRCRQFADS